MIVFTKHLVSDQRIGYIYSWKMFNVYQDYLIYKNYYIISRKTLT